MKTTKSQKVSFAVLGLAVSAFVIDRICFTPGSAVAASPVAELVSNGASKVEAAVAGQASAAADGLIASKLNSLQGIDLDQVRNAFQPSKAWVSAQHPAIAHQEHAVQIDFSATHKLTAIMASKTGGVAMVDGVPVRVGQKVDGFKLVSVNSRSAVFSSGGAQVTLQLMGQ